MNGKTFFTFLILFSLILVLGCLGGQSGQLSQASTSSQISKGNINASISVNGKPSTEVNLLGEQTAEVSMRIKNSGTVQMKNLETTVVGCLTLESDKPAAEDVPPGSDTYLSWTLKAPEMGQGERINCQVIIRTCYDYTTDGYVEIPVASEDYNEEISAPSAFTRSDVLSVTPQIGILRVVKDQNTYVSRMTVTNTGPGWIDYLKYIDGKEMYKLEKIDLTVSGNLRFDSYSGFSAEKLKNAHILGDGYWLSADGKTLTIDAVDTQAEFDATVTGYENYAYLLKMVSGKELTLNFNLGADKADYPDITYERLTYTLQHGYCTDIATITAHLSGT
jgi:hypothetical protein